MKKELFKNIIKITFGFALMLGLGFVSAAGTWNDPTSVAPAGNPEILVNSSATGQIKNAGLAVNSFLVAQNAEFNQRVFFHQPIAGGTETTPGHLKIGGWDVFDPNAVNENTVQTTVTGKVAATGPLGSDELVSTQNERLCADSQGHVVFCSTQPTVIQSSFDVSYGPDVNQPGGVHTNRIYGDCSASLDVPARAQGETVTITATGMTTNFYETDSSQDAFDGFCTVSIPAGAQFATTQRYQLHSISSSDLGAGSVDVYSHCVDSSTTLVAPGLHC